MPRITIATVLTRELPVQLPIRPTNNSPAWSNLRRTRFGSWVAAAIVTLCIGAGANAADVRVLHAESISITDLAGTPAAGNKWAQRNNQRSSLRFVAYGRSFTLEMQAHKALNEFGAR